MFHFCFDHGFQVKVLETHQMSNSFSSSSSANNSQHQHQSQQQQQQQLIQTSTSDTPLPKSIMSMTSSSPSSNMMMMMTTPQPVSRRAQNHQHDDHAIELSSTSLQLSPAPMMMTTPGSTFSSPPSSSPLIYSASFTSPQLPTNSQHSTNSSSSQRQNQTTHALSPVVLAATRFSSNSASSVNQHASASPSSSASIAMNQNAPSTVVADHKRNLLVSPSPHPHPHPHPHSTMHHAHGPRAVIPTPSPAPQQQPPSNLYSSELVTSGAAFTRSFVSGSPSPRTVLGSGNLDDEWAIEDVRAETIEESSHQHDDQTEPDSLSLSSASLQSPLRVVPTTSNHRLHQTEALSNMPFQSPQPSTSFSHGKSVLGRTFLSSTRKA